MSTPGTVEIGDSTTGRARNRQDLGSIESVRTWNVNFIDLPTEELIKLCFDIFQDMRLEEFAITDDIVIGFLKAVASYYRANPYHTFLHACYVLHAVWMILTTTALPRYLLPHEKLALYIAAICHDVDHDGYTNQFHISSGSEMARRYNDQSVLEHHHCNLTFVILNKQDCTMLKNVSPELQIEIREVVIQYIMGTDMSYHDKLISELCLLELPETNKNGSLVECPAQIRKLLGKSILHASDLSNPARSFEVDLFMAESVQEEFRKLAVRERELELPVSSHINVQTDAMKYQAEVNFIDYTAKPLWERLAQLFPSLEICLHQMKANRDQFARLAEIARTQEASISPNNSTHVHTPLTSDD